MASSMKKGAFFDDDNDAELVCLSSDTDDDENFTSDSAATKTAEASRKVNGDGSPPKLQPRTVRRPDGVINGQGSGGNRIAPTTSKPKIEPGGDDDDDDEPHVYTLDDDDDDFEFEYSQNDDAAVRKVTQAPESDDDEIQVLEDGGPPVRFAKKRTSQESKVNLGLPGLNLGLIAAGSNSKFKNNESSQDIEEIDCETDTDVTEEVDNDHHKDNNSDMTVEEATPSIGSTSVDYAEESRRALVRFVNEFCARKHRGTKTDQLNKARQKIMDAFEKIKNFPMLTHVRLKQDFEDSLNLIRSTKDHWKTVKNVLDCMDPATLRITNAKTDDERQREREKKKMEIRIKYEKELAKIQRKIRKLEEAEVDWEDEVEHNSSYILGDKYKSKMIENYYTLCDLSNCNHFTGRPTQTRINLRKHNKGSNIEEINTAVEEFVNKQGFMFAPDYTDILETITKVNQNKSLGLRQDEILKTAQNMFEDVMKIIKKRREKDFKMYMLAFLPKSKPSETVPSTESERATVEDDDDDNMEDRLLDPADMDAELRAKLEENEKMKGSESEVLEKYLKMSEGQSASVVEGENVNDSPPPSDNEEEDEEDDEVNAAEVSKDHEHDELTEDEDEEPETVSSGWNGTVLPADLDDDNSNEDKTTAESESDNNVDVIEENSSRDAEDDVQMTDLPTPPTSSTAPLIGTESTGDTCVESEQAELTNLPKKKAEESSDDIQPPPAKRMRPDENFNEDASSNSGAAPEPELEPKAVTESPPV